MLDKQVSNEPVENLRFVIQSIADNFNKALDANTEVEIREALSVIKNKENYLAEKYRDTPEERFYIENVNKAIQYLESLSG